MRFPRDPLTLAAFAGAVVIGGLNVVAVRLSNAELPPFWGATLRFAAAALILFGVVALMRVPLPRGRALVGTLLYGVLGFAAGYALAYWALVEVPAGTASVVMALVPLLTLLLAVVHGLERLHLRAVVGALLAIAGVAIVFGDRIVTTDVPIISLGAMVLAAATAAETSVIVKRFPRSQPLAANAIGMGLGALLLAAVAVGAGESRSLPEMSTTWLTLTYLVVVGSIALFALFLFVLSRWSASTSSYMFVLSPFVAIPVSAVITGEPLSLAFLAGGALVLAGVYAGAQMPRAPTAATPATPLPECCPPAVMQRPQSPARSVSAIER